MDPMTHLPPTMAMLAAACTEGLDVAKPTGAHAAHFVMT